MFVLACTHANIDSFPYVLYQSCCATLQQALPYVLSRTNCIALTHLSILSAICLLRATFKLRSMRLAMLAPDLPSN